MEQKLRQLVNQPSLTKDNCAFIRECAIKLSIPIKNTRCSSRFKDHAIILVNHLERERLKLSPSGSYELVDGLNILWHGKVINKHTVTQEDIEYLIKKGFTYMLKKKQ